MKSNFENFHKPAAHTSTHSHKKKRVWQERQAGEEKGEKLPPLFGRYFQRCKLMTIMTIPLGGAAWAETAGRSHV